MKLVGEIETWEDGARFDWLHPTHGPFPDLCLLYQDEHDEYTVAVWDGRDGEDLILPNVWIAAAVGPPECHSNQLQSYRWEADQKRRRLFCQLTKTRGAYVDIEGKPDNDEIRWVVADRTLMILTG